MLIISVTACVYFNTVHKKNQFFKIIFRCQMFEWFLDLCLSHIMGVFGSLNYVYCPIRIILARISPFRVFFFSQYIYLFTPSRNWEGWLWLYLEYIDIKHYGFCLDACTCTYGFDTCINIIIYKPRNHPVNYILKWLLWIHTSSISAMKPHKRTF